MINILLQAAPAAQGPMQQYGSIIFFVAIFGIMYFLMIRPQQKKQKETQRMLESLQVNDKVITVAGIIGRIVSIKPDKNIVVLEIDDTNKVRVEFQKSAVIGLITPDVK
jgi:preprotein translocase subunit YajC